MAEDGKKKGGKLKKFFLFALFASAVAAIVKFAKGRRQGLGDNEWQELPPPDGG
ncbi:MAG: hypothetical protein WD757_05205 [Actinomycetota bacterium]